MHKKLIKADDLPDYSYYSGVKAILTVHSTLM